MRSPQPERWCNDHRVSSLEITHHPEPKRPPAPRPEPRLDSDDLGPLLAPLLFHQEVRLALRQLIIIPDDQAAGRVEAQPREAVQADFLLADGRGSGAIVVQHDGDSGLERRERQLDGNAAVTDAATPNVLVLRIESEAVLMAPEPQRDPIEVRRERRDDLGINVALECAERLVVREQYHRTAVAGIGEDDPLEPADARRR